MNQSLLQPGGLMSEKKVSCARPTGGVVGEEQKEPETTPKEEPKGVQTMIKVGKKAPDFSAPAYFNNEFTSVQLSDYLGQWVVLCFYPGDFTFV